MGMTSGSTMLVSATPKRHTSALHNTIVRIAATIRFTPARRLASYQICALDKVFAVRNPYKLFGGNLRITMGTDKRISNRGKYNAYSLIILLPPDRSRGRRADRAQTHPSAAHM